MHPRPSLSLTLLAIGLAGACSNQPDVRPEPAPAANALAGSGGAVSTSLAGGTGGAGTAGSKPAPTSCRQDRPGPPMVLVQKPGGAFCIDQRETNRGEYAKFLNAVGETPAKDADCKNNLSYQPNRTDRSHLIPDAGPPKADCYDNIWAKEPPSPEATLSCVDYCDARDYCAWIGKRLCTASPEGTTKESAAKAGNAGEWNLACSNGGRTTYPYGDGYEPGRCRDKVSSKLQNGPPPYVSGSIPECKGVEPPYDGLLDMSGSVGEWTAECIEPGGCLSYGGGLNAGIGPEDHTGERLSCWFPLSGALNLAGPTVGIRCCADD